MRICLRLLVWCVSLAIGATVAGCSSREPQKTSIDLLIVDATLIDPGSSSVLAGSDVAIDDGRIVALGPDAGADFSATTLIDGTGRFVVPALTDMHLHWGNGAFAGREDLVEVTLARTLYYGVTRILNMGSNSASPAEIDSFRARLREGAWQGPQIYAVGSLLTVPGSHPTTTIFPPPLQKQIADTVAAAPATGPIDLMPLRAITLVRTPDDARAEVQRLGAWGADAIKITVESGPGPFGDDHPQMSEDIVAATVEAARAASIPVIAHISSRDELDICLRTGVAAAAHAIIDGPFDADLHRRMGEAKFFYIATLDLYDGMVNWSADPKRLEDDFLRETLTDDEAASMAPAAMAFAAERNFFGEAGIQPVLDHVRDAYRAGAILLTGTDTGNPFAFPGYGVHQELSLMVQAGVAPMDALAAATANAAKFFGEDAQWGSLSPGQAADLLILDADPLVDIANTRRISHVIQRGRPVDRSTLRVR